MAMLLAQKRTHLTQKSPETLRDMRPGDRAVVVKVNGEGALRRRLFDMGITPGAEVLVRKFAPLGDPVEITLRGYELSLRKTEAEAVLVSAK